MIGVQDSLVFIEQKNYKLFYEFHPLSKVLEFVLNFIEVVLNFKLILMLALIFLCAIIIMIINDNFH